MNCYRFKVRALERAEWAVGPGFQAEPTPAFRTALCAPGRAGGGSLSTAAPALVCVHWAPSTCTHLHCSPLGEKGGQEEPHSVPQAPPGPNLDPAPIL